MRPLLDVCRRFMHREEGLVLHSYDDHDGRRITFDRGHGKWIHADGSPIRGFPTIGRGRRLWPGEEIESCTVEEADAWFDSRVIQVDLPMVDKYWPDADDYQRGSLADYSYNCGSGAIPRDKFHEIFAAGGYDALEKVWITSRVTSNGQHAPVLVGRRAREFKLFCTLRDHPELRTATDEDVARAIAARFDLTDELESLQVTVSENEDPH